MVATFIHKAVSKAYVRLPGSGSDKGAGAIFCDLSHGSNLAAIISVPQHVGMPRYLTAQPSTVTPTTNNKRSRTEDYTVDADKSNKRLCTYSTNHSVTRASSDHTIKPVSVPVTMSPHELSGNFTTTTNRANKLPVRETQNGTRASSDHTIKPVAVHTIKPVAVPVTMSPHELCGNFTTTTNRANKLPVRETQNGTIASSDHTIKPLAVHTIKPVAVPVTVSPHELSSNFTPTTNRANNAYVRETQNGARASSDHTIKPVAVPVTVSHHELSSNFTPTTNRANNEPVRETQNPTKLFTIRNTVNDETKLHEENIHLRSENANLQKQLSLFKQLIRNPQRLQSVLQSLKEIV